jgi:TPR repeat protein
MYNLGICYQYEVSVINYEEARKYYAMADAAGYPLAKTALLSLPVATFPK